MRVTKQVRRYSLGHGYCLVNYTERHRSGLRVGTVQTEATADFLVNRRMNKSHMWTASSSQDVSAVL
jgi:hypothetical protein